MRNGSHGQQPTGTTRRKRRRSTRLNVVTAVVLGIAIVATVSTVSVIHSSVESASRYIISGIGLYYSYPYVGRHGGDGDRSIDNDGSSIKNTRHRVYCMVPTMDSDSEKAKWTAILETWGRHCDVLRFFVDGDEQGAWYYWNATVRAAPSSSSLGDNDDNEKATHVRAKVIQIKTLRPRLCVSRDADKAKAKPCRNIWEKVWRTWQYVDEHDADEADWYVKVDTDTFFFPQNLRDYVASMRYQPSDPYYFGHQLRHAGPMIAGSSSAFSREALRRLAASTGSNATDKRCADGHGVEEPFVGGCLYSKGVVPRDAFDERGREKFMVLTLGEHLTIVPSKDIRLVKKYYEWYFGFGNPQTNWGKDCCSDRPIALHRIQPDQMRAMYSLFTQQGNHSDDRGKFMDVEREYLSTVKSGFSI
mmetsp:Transcript_30272/g.66568  ORF Transcript_30272/g.66568 Transcript_30272/m.66568 type:complete len:417 (+) Transcript_30272:233-1483(+)